jgi:hypothetical protein
VYVGTALDAAAYHNRLNVVKLLLDNGARGQVDEESSYGEDTISAAREQGGEMTRLISKVVGRKWDEIPVKSKGEARQVTRVYGDITAITADKRDLHLRG